MINEARKIVATGLDTLKIENPLVFVGLVLVGNIFIAGVNHPALFTEYTGLPVNELTTYIRDGLIVLMTTSSVSTFKDLPNSHPKKVKASGEVSEQIEKF